MGRPKLISTHIDDDRRVDTVTKAGSVARVVRGRYYLNQKSVACEIKDTRNGLIARFPAVNSVTQDKYVCLDYSEARDLVLGLSAFKEDLGFE